MIAILLAAQLAAVAHAADTVGACEPLMLSVAVSSPGSVLPRLIAPSLAPFDVMRSASMPHVERDSRAVPSVIVEYQYVLASAVPGTYTIPAFEVQLGRLSARTEPLRVVVTPSSGDAEPALITRARIETGLQRDPREAAPETVYVGQQADYVVAVFLNSEMRGRLRRNPTFYPPDMQSLLAYDLAGGGTSRQPATNSRCFDALVYRRALFPLQPGRIVIPPAQLTYALPVGSSFFSREESHDVQTDSAVIVAVDPPAAGRPADFDGAVGAFSVSARLDAPTGRVGDPITLTERVSGTGNVKLLPRPRLSLAWASAVPSDERVQVDSSGARIGGSKDFDWILTPRVAGEFDVPPVHYSYFNPSARQYEVATSASAKLQVRPGSLASVDTARTDSLLPLRSVYRGAVGRPWSSYPIFWLALALAPLPALGERWRDRRRRAKRRSLAPTARLEATVRAAGGSDGRALRKSFVAALAERLRLEPEALASPGALRHALRRAGVSADVADAGESLLRELDVAAFSENGSRSTDASESVLALMRRIDEEALPARELPFRALALVVIAVLGVGGSLRALSRDVPADVFETGLVAYQHRDFSAAQRAFARVTTVEPRAADAWMNFGTAAWAAHDTVDAVVGWRRALGLQPLAGDARGRLVLVHGVRMLSPGYVPPMPPDALMLLLACCWLAACVAWHPAARRREPWLVRAAPMFAIAAAVVGLAAIAANARLAARNLAVAQTSTTLSDDPALGSDRGPTVVIGEIVRVLSQSGAWSRVQLDGGRQGWVPAQQLVALDAPLPPALD